jgi:two-component system chemotaxis response regulator CheB
MVDQLLKLSNLARPHLDPAEVKLVGDGCTYGAMLEAVRRHSPQVIVVELGGPTEDAFAAIEAVMADYPTPILVVNAHSTPALNPFRALALGALDVAERPAGDSPAFWRNLSEKIALIAQVQVVRHIKGTRLKRRQRPESDLAPAFPLVAIAASLGGPRALSTILRMIPKAFPAPICVCQHISDGFTDGLAQWLSCETTLRVTEAKDGEALAPGSVFIAPSQAHLLVTHSGRIQLDNGPPRLGFRPSCDALLISAAEAFGRRAIGVVLTGMGRDGAHGLKQIRMRGGHTIVQDRASCVVFGMPKEAVEIGAAEQVLALEKIAPALIQLADHC